MKLLCVLAVASLVLATGIRTATEIPADVTAGFRAGRSGNVILKPTHHTDVDAIAIVVDESQKFASEKSSTTELDVSHVADVRARSLGVSTPNPTFNADFLKNDFFTRPRANIMINIESIGDDMLAKYSLHETRLLKSAARVFALRGQSYPLSTLADATTMATGTSPARHGIVSHQWKNGNGKTSAYSGADSWAQTATVADVLAQTFDGQSLLLSVSANAQHAAAFSVNPSLISRHPEWNNFCVSLKDAGFVTFVAAPHSQSLSISPNTLLSMLARNKLWDSTPGVSPARIKLDLSSLEKDHTVTVTYPLSHDNVVQYEKVVFDLNEPEQFALFAELLYVDHLPNALKAAGMSNLVSDDVPDLITVTFSALTKLIEKHGRNSPQVVAGMHLIDTALPALVDELSGLYPGRAVCEVVLMGSHPSFAFGSAVVDTRDLFATVNRLLPHQDAKTYYPALYVESTHAALPEVCQVLAIELEKSNFNVYCPEAHTVQPTAFFELTAASTAAAVKAGNFTGQTSVFRYQVALWMCIALALAVLMAAYALAWMTFKKDTLLYSTFNPNWEDRKRK